MKICVIGEEFKDRWFIGSASRLSPEAAVPVVKVTEVLEFMGGAGNVTMNLAALGVNTFNITQGSVRPTKNRLVVGNQQLARWDENDICLPPRLSQEWEPLVADCDGYIISDYGKGMFDDAMLGWLDIYCDRRKPCFVDTKAHPGKYQFLNPIYFPNQQEWSQYARAYERLPQAVFKQGPEGISWMEEGTANLYLPACTKPNEVVSVSGAGDTVIAAFAYAYLAENGNIGAALAFANRAAAVVVRKPYTATATLQEIDDIWLQH